MSDDIAKKGPERSLSQEIGDDARATFNANKPKLWNFGEGAGDDFGYDFQVTAFGFCDAGAQCAFNIQLKGTTQAKARSSDGHYLSYPFNRTTLNLWHTSGFAVLVAIADLIDIRDPKEAKIYYHFANPDLDAILPTLPPNQKTVTLRVPTNQLIHRELNILPVIKPYLDEASEHRRLKLAARGQTTDNTTMLSAQGYTNTNFGVVAFGDEIETIIDTAFRKAELKAALSALRSGDYNRVLQLAILPSIEEQEKAPQESAACAYLRARAFDEVGDIAAANEMINTASELFPNNDDIAAMVAQRQLDVIDYGPAGRDARQSLLKSLEAHNGVNITNLKAKLYALENDFDFAREILNPLSPEKSAITKVIISTVEQAWERALAEIEESRRLPALNSKQLFWLDALESKAYLQLALADIKRPSEGDFIIPSNGLPGIDYGKLRRAYDAGLRSMLAGQRLNWPASIEHFIDVFPISSMLLGYAQESLPLLASLALSRPNITPIREVVAKFAVQLGQPQIALQLSDLSGNSVCFEHESAVMAVAALKSGNSTKALNYVTDEFLSDPSTKDFFLTSLMLMGLAADSALRLELLEKIRARLDNDEESRHYRAIMESALQLQRSLLYHPEAIRQLYTYWTSHGQPTTVGLHLLVNADPRDLDEAKVIVDVATKVEISSSLGAEHLANYSQALITLGKFKDAITHLEGACERFDHDPRIKSLLGIAMELDGQSANAYKLIGQLLESGEASETARKYFIQIAARIGFFESAEEQVRAALAKATVTGHRLQHLNTLFQLLLAAGDRQKDMEEVAWEYGKLANQEDEGEEGIFLQEYLVATLPRELEVLPERVMEFRRRLEAYNAKFPKSKHLWRIDIPAEGSPDAMLAALHEAAGVTDQEIEDSIAVERKMDRGAMQVPFSWRPRRFLRNISDVFMLWQLRKQVPHERAAFHFQCSLAGYDRHTPSDINDTEAVLSLTSLLVLDEIGLLGTVLNSFQRLVVARSTLITLQDARNTFTGGWGCEKATRIMRELQGHFAKISHPPYPIEDSSKGLPDWHQEEKIAMQQAGRVYFCDDIVETFFVCGDGENVMASSSMSTIDFLDWANQSAGILSAKMVADSLGALIRLKVGVITVNDRYFIAAIPDELQSATSLEEENEAISRAETFRSILGGIWDPAMPFDDLRSHFARIMSYLLNKGNASEAVLVALWLRWLQTVRFQAKPLLSVELKLASGFVGILSQLESDKQVVHRLWQSLWTAFKRGLGGELHEPEDMAGIRVIAKVLGFMRARDKTNAEVGVLFDRARLGLEQGTEPENEFGRVYVVSTAEETKKQMASKKTKHGLKHSDY